MVTPLSHKQDDVGSNPMAATNDDLAQWLRALHTVKVDSSNLSVITRMRFNSMAENYRYKVVVVGSIPTVATKLARSSTGRCIRLLTGGL